VPGELKLARAGDLKLAGCRPGYRPPLAEHFRASLCRVLQAQVHSAERAFSKAAEKVRTVLQVLRVACATRAAMT